MILTWGWTEEQRPLATRHVASTGWGIIFERKVPGTSTCSVCRIVCKRDSRATGADPCTTLLVGCRSGIQKAEETLEFGCLHCRSTFEQVTFASPIAQGKTDLYGVSTLETGKLHPENSFFLFFFFLQDREGTWGWLAEMETSLFQIYIGLDEPQP